MRILPVNLSIIVCAILAPGGLVSANDMPVSDEGTTIVDSPPAADIPLPVDSTLVVKSNPQGVVTDAAGSMAKDPQAEIATMLGDSSAQPVEHDAETSKTDPVRSAEEVWSEISQAISGLNDMVGDEMFRDLRRTDNNRMEVRVDLDYWQRVRYQTRVDLKNDISNIWHLYVQQYSDDPGSSVFFIDDDTNKTIDIFSQAQ